MFYRTDQLTSGLSEGQETGLRLAFGSIWQQLTPGAVGNALVR